MLRKIETDLKRLAQKLLHLDTQQIDSYLKEYIKSTDDLILGLDNLKSDANETNHQRNFAEFGLLDLHRDSKIAGCDVNKLESSLIKKKLLNT